MFVYFCCRWIFRIIFTSINFLYYTFKICISKKMALYQIFLPQGNAILHLKPFFMIWDMFWNKNKICLFFLAHKTWRTISTLFFSMFFELFFSDGKPILSHLHLFIEDLIFVILCGSFCFFHDFTWVLQQIESIHCLFIDRYPIRRIYIWSTTIQIYFMTFIIQ